MKRTHGLDEREMELVKLLMADCQTTGDIQAKLKKLFAGTIERDARSGNGRTSRLREELRSREQLRKQSQTGCLRS